MDGRNADRFGEYRVPIVPLMLKVRGIMRVTAKDCEYLVSRINNVRRKGTPRLIFASRNGYRAIDYEAGQGMGTLRSGLSTREAYEVLEGIYSYLCLSRCNSK